MELFSSQSMIGLLFLSSFSQGCRTLKSIINLDFPETNPVEFILKRESLLLLKNRVILPPASMLPAKLNPAGLSLEHKQYLYRDIRHYYKPEAAIADRTLFVVFV